MRKRNLIKMFGFIFIMFCLLGIISDILCNSAGVSWATQTGMENVHKYENFYDVMFLGTSTVISNISNQELYEKYGVAGVSVGEPEQLVYLTEYTLKEALAYQKPSVVFFDTKAMFYSEDEIKEKTIEHKENVHNIVESIRSLKVKKEALDAISTYDREMDIWEYYSKLYYGHKNWESIGKANFMGYNAWNCMNGNIALSNNFENINYKYDDSSISVSEISQCNENAFAEMVQMCNNAGIDFVMITGYLSTKSQHDKIARLAEKYNVEFIDINEDFQEVGLDIDVDFHDGVHFNINGAVKWTDYLGAYLEKNYEFLDKREDDRYGYFEKQREVFNAQKKFVSTKIALLSAITFDDYLEELRNIDCYKNLIFISVYDDASASLTGEEVDLLRGLGLQQADLRGYWRASYIAAISNERILEEFSEEEAVKIDNSEDGVLFRLASGGYTSTEVASIEINGREYMQKGRGINVVVFNKDLGLVVSSVYFDTSAVCNPYAGRLFASQIEQKQIEVGKNIWENQ